MSDLHLVAMPKWGLSMEEGMVVAWHKQVGDTVAKGDDLIDVETSKITNTVEAPVAGLIRRIIAETGITAACGAPLAVISAADVSDEAIDLFVSEYGGGEGQVSTAGTSAPAGPVFRSLEFNGESYRIRYLDTGAGDQTIILIHGFGGDLDNWMFNQPVLAAGMRVIAIDLPGHGGSDKRVGDGSAATLAGLVTVLLDDIAPGPVHLVAHSFGAMVARAIAAAAPDRIASFTAIAPADLGKVERGFIDGFIGARRRSELSVAIGLLFANPDLASRDMAEALLRYKRLDGVDQALRLIDAVNLTRDGPDPAGVALWQQLGSKGLLIWGAEDAIVPFGSAQTDFAGVSTVIVTAAGHMPHLEKSEQVNAAIISHVANHRSKP